MQIISPEVIRKTVTEADALEAADLAFRALGEHTVSVAPPQGLQVHDRRGELHVKSAYLHGSRFFVTKAATGFYDNAQHGLPSGSGLMLLFDAITGFPLALLQDNGYLTEMRTAAAGTLATKLLATRNFKRVAILGAGAQARYHLRAFQNAFQWEHTWVWSRRSQSARVLCEELRGQVGCELEVAPSAREAVAEADVVVTVTPSHTPILEGDWLAPHATIIAIGSDGPEKRELAADVFQRAQRVVVDLRSQCATLGELHHALAEDATRLEDTVELGEIVSGRKMGRLADELIVCDLTGVGAQDAAIAEIAYRKLTMGESATDQAESARR